jgi:two-component system chemotaxis sensor kinase CheA
VPTELAEPLELAGAGLDRVTSEIQVAVMRTRMQPLDKLFGKYPRLIRDLSKKTGKKLELKIVGAARRRSTSRSSRNWATRSCTCSGTAPTTGSRPPEDRVGRASPTRARSRCARPTRATTR